MFYFWKQEGSFAQLKLWQSASIAVVFFVSPYITFQTMLVVMLVALCIAIAGFLFLTLKVERSFSSNSSSYWSSKCYEVCFCNSIIHVAHADTLSCSIDMWNIECWYVVQSQQLCFFFQYKDPCYGALFWYSVFSSLIIFYNGRPWGFTLEADIWWVILIQLEVHFADTISKSENFEVQTIWQK